MTKQPFGENDARFGPDGQVTARIQRRVAPPAPRTAVPPTPRAAVPPAPGRAGAVTTRFTRTAPPHGSPSVPVPRYERAGSPTERIAVTSSSPSRVEQTVLTHLTPPPSPTEKPTTPDEPGPRRSRLRGVDMARGLALLGMIAVHTMPLTDDNGQATTVTQVAAGTSAALFGFLAGISVALLTGRHQVVSGDGRAGRQALRLAVRGLAVGAIGLVLGSTNPGDVDIILTYYGVLFLFAVPLVFQSTRALFVIGAALVVIAPVTDFLVRAQLPPVEVQDPSFGALVSDPVGLLSTLLFTGAYPAWPWLAYICLGIAVGRCRLERVRTAAVLAASGVGLAATAAVVSYAALHLAGGLDAIQANPGLPADQLATTLAEGPDGVTPTTTWWWLAVDLPHSATPLFLAYTVGTSLAVLGAMLLLDHALARPGTLARLGDALRSPLAAAGSMTLTFYSLHVVFIGVAPKADPWVLYLGQIVAALAVGAVWRATVGRGPLEAGVGKLVDAVAPRPASPGPPQERRHATPIALAALVLAVAACAAVAIAFVPSTVPADSPAGGQIDTPAQVDTPDAPDLPGEADTPDSPDTGNDPQDADTPDDPQEADTPGQPDQN